MGHTTRPTSEEPAVTHSPKTPKDLALAPVAVGIDLNLQRLRAKETQEGIEFELQLELDRPAFADTREERADRVLRVALRDVDMHGWAAAMTPDGSAVRITGGSVSLDVSVGAAAQRFIDVAPVAA
jgi:hypothetical protein